MTDATPDSLRIKLNQFFGSPELPDRVSKVWSSIELDSSILEISPNWAPLVIKDDLKPNGKIFYCDRMPTEWLNNRESENPARLNHGLHVMESDFVWTPGELLSECTGEKFDFVISSHVVEHVPDLLGHMIEIADVLRSGGKYVFVIPNGRGTGEYFRRLSEESDVVEHFFRGGQRTSPGQNWDYLQNAVKYDGTKFFGRSKSDFVRHHTDAEAIQDATRCFREYVDVHSWVFSRSSFISIVSRFNQLQMFPFRVLDFQESSTVTPDGEPFEFIVTLQKCDYQIPKTWLDTLSQIAEDKPDLSDRTAPYSVKNENSLRENSSEYKQSIRYLQAEVESTKNELKRLINSKSWKITAPLRLIRRFFQR